MKSICFQLLFLCICVVGCVEKQPQTISIEFEDAGYSITLPEKWSYVPLRNLRGVPFMQDWINDDLSILDGVYTGAPGNDFRFPVLICTHNFDGALSLSEMHMTNNSLLESFAASADSQVSIAIKESNFDEDRKLFFFHRARGDESRSTLDFITGLYYTTYGSVIISGFASGDDTMAIQSIREVILNTTLKPGVTISKPHSK